jgi:hypothetical protein
MLAAALGLALALPAQAAERAMANVECAPTDERLVYDCMIHLMGKKSHAALEGASIKIKADMPTMPMAHNMRPVDATPMGKPGMYKARLHLEMHGEWALRMEISGPTRDLVVEKVMFGSEGQAMKHGEEKSHDHGAKEEHKMEGHKKAE